MQSAVNPITSLGKLMPDQRDAMQKLLASHTLASSPRLREVLAHLVASLENGNAEQINEQSLGQEVFGKPAGYNASEDNIVRVTLRHLRSRLEEYYHSEGRTDAWVLTIPKGKYVPVLIAAEGLPHQPVAASIPNAIATSAEPAKHLETETNRKAFALPMAVAACVILLLGVAAGYLLKANLATSARGSGGILGQLSRVGDDISVVVVDSNLQAYRQIFHHQVTLDDYIHRSYAKDPLDSTDPRLADARQFATGAIETNVSSAIVGAAVRQALDGRRLSIKHPHDLSMREFQDQKSVILLGGPNINPWGQLFEGRLNFRILPGAGAPASSMIQNTKPNPGEPPAYLPHTDGNLAVNYVRIAILPNFTNSGHVILLGATNPDALEAAGTYLLSDDAVTELDGLFHVHSVAALPALEFVLEVRGLNSVPDSHRIVSSRTVASNTERAR